MYLRAYSGRNQMTYGDMYLSSSSDNISLDSTVSSSSSLEFQSRVGFTSSEESLAEMPHAKNMTFCNIDELCEDLKIIISMKDMCDVMFLVGQDEEPVYAVRAILATRSRVFYNQFLSEDSTRHQCKQSKQKGILSRLLKLQSCTRVQTPKEIDDKFTIAVPHADPTDFRSLIKYLHTGSITVSIDNLPGLLHLSCQYQVKDITEVCMDFAHRNMSSNKNLLPVLDSLERYKHSQHVSHLFDKVLSLIDHEAECLLMTKELLDLSRDSAFSILLRPELNATEETKLAAILRWSQHFHNNKKLDDFRHTVNILLTNVDLSQIAPDVLKRDIAPLKVVPYEQLWEYVMADTASDVVITKPTVGKTRKSLRERKRSSQDTRTRKQLFKTEYSRDSGFNISSNSHYF